MIEIILVLVLIGVLLYLVQQIPMDATIKMLIKVVVIVCVILWLVQVLGLLGHDLPPPRLFNNR